MQGILRKVFRRQRSTGATADSDSLVEAKNVRFYGVLLPTHQTEHWQRLLSPLDDFLLSYIN
jgi:hypothetical protein